LLDSLLQESCRAESEGRGKRKVLRHSQRKARYGD